MISPTYIQREKRWKYRYTYYDDSGIRREKVFSSSKRGEQGKREVIAKFRAWRGNSFESVWECYIQDRTHRLGETSPTLRNEVTFGNNYFLPAFSGKAIDNLKTSDYQEFINTLRLQNGKKPSSKYLRDLVSVLKQFLAWAWDNEYLYEALRGKLYLPKGLTTQGKDIPTLTEFRSICEPCNLHYQPLIIFLFTTGMRPSEAIGLKKEDVVDGIAYIKRGVLRNHTISEGKTQNARRAVPLCSLAQEQVNKMIDAFPDSEYIFCNTLGEVAFHDSVYKQLKTICKRCGIEKNISLYSARHFFVTYAGTQLGLQQTQHTVGHSSSMSTVSTYSHSNSDEQKQIRSILDDIFCQ